MRDYTSGQAPERAIGYQARTDPDDELDGRRRSTSSRQPLAGLSVRNARSTAEMVSHE